MTKYRSMFLPKIGPPSLHKEGVEGRFLELSSCHPPEVPRFSRGDDHFHPRRCCPAAWMSLLILFASLAACARRTVQQDSRFQTLEGFSVEVAAPGSQTGSLIALTF